MKTTDTTLSSTIRFNWRRSILAGLLVFAALGPVSAQVSITGADFHAVPEGETITLTGSGFTGTTAASLYWRQDQYPATFTVTNNTTLEFVMPDIIQDTRDYHLVVESATGSTVGVPTGHIEHSVTGPLGSGDTRAAVVVRSGGVLSGTVRNSLVVVEAGGVLEFSNDMGAVNLLIAEDGAVVDFTGVSSNVYTTFLYSPETVVIGTIPTTTGGQLIGREVTPITPSYGLDTFTVGGSIDVTIIGEGTVQRDPDLTYYPLFDRVQLTAVPGPGQTFSGWSGDVVSSEASIEVSVESGAPPAVTATFSPGWLLELPVVTGVTVTRDPEKAVYAEGESVTLNAEVQPGYEFLGWGGNAGGATTPSVTLTMDSNRQVLPMVRRLDYDQLPQITGVDYFAAPEGETITLTGTGLGDAAVARFFWAIFDFPATTNPVDDSTLEVVLPDFFQDIREHVLLVETATGCTLALPSDCMEHFGTGPLVGSSRSQVAVVKAGAILTGDPRHMVVAVEAGGLFEVPAESSTPNTIFAENGAVIDFTNVSTHVDYQFFYSPETVILGTIPSDSDGQSVGNLLTPIALSPSLGTFTVGYPLPLTIEGPGSVAVTPSKEFYAYNESVTLTATPDAEAFFIRWIGSTSSHSPVITTRVGRDMVLISRFSTTPDYFSSWRPEHFTVEELANPLISGFDADPDRDFLTNAAEYAFGSDPRSASGNRKIKVESKKVDGVRRSFATYYRPRNALDVEYRIMASTNFSSWNYNGDGSDLLVSRVISVEEIDDDVEKVTVELFPELEAPKTLFMKISAILF